MAVGVRLKSCGSTTAGRQLGLLLILALAHGRFFDFIFVLFFFCIRAKRIYVEIEMCEFTAVYLM